MNDGYSTQDKYSSANLRTNLDIDLTGTTKLKLNILGTLSESSRPGTSSTDLWDMVYSIPSAAFRYGRTTARGEEAPLGRVH